MKKNMGSTDRIIRLTLAALLLYFYYAGIITGTWGIVLVAFSVVFAITSFAGVCPLYIPFGISTLHRNKNHVSNPSN